MDRQREAEAARQAALEIAARSASTPKRDGAGGYLVRCPCHADDRPSLHVSSGESQPVVLHCLAGCPTEAILEALGWSWARLCGGPQSSCDESPDAEYEYRDLDGRLCFIVARYGQGAGKRFQVWSLDVSGKRVYGARGQPRILYRAAEVAAAVAAGRPVYLCEGEKDADAMRQAYGVTATTNPFGATAWAKDAESYARPLRGAKVVIVQDRDATGRRRTQQLLVSLTGVGASLRIVEAAVGKDAFDHVAAGRRLEELVACDEQASAIVDDGSFVGLPRAFFAAAAACNLSHLEYRLLVEIGCQTVRREKHLAVWPLRELSSSWLARCAGNASPTAVRACLRRLKQAAIVLDEHDGRNDGHTHRLGINGDFAGWRALSRG